MPLSPSQRISLIKEAATRLSNEEWPLIDLTLKQFDLPWLDTWSGTKDAYIITNLESASDEILLDLTRHLGFVFEHTGGSSIEPAFWERGKLRLFISHLASHRKWTGELQTALLPYGISSFVAHNDIKPTLAWQGQIELALSTCDALVALLHEKFHESKWTDQEVGFAMGRGIPVYSVKLGEDPYGFIGQYQAFNGRGLELGDLALELFEAYTKDKQTQKRMSEVLVTLFEQSSSFAQAKTRIGYLEDLEIWEPSFCNRIELAAENNGQISGSWGVPSRVTQLVKKWRISKVRSKK